MVDQLFGSKTRVKLLKFFFANQDQEFFVRELTRLLDEQINSIRRELINLADVGVVGSATKDNKVFYSLNKKSLLYKGLDMMLSVDSDGLEGQEGGVEGARALTKQKGRAKSEAKRKGIIIEDAKLKLVKEELCKAVQSVVFIAVSGVLLKSKAVGPDIMVVADASEMGKLKKAIEVLEKKLNKGLSFVLIEPGDYVYRSKINDRFLTAFLRSKHEILLSKLEK